MQRGAVFLVEPVTGVERQELDFRSFGKVRGFINDEPSSLHASLKRHVTTVPRTAYANKPSLYVKRVGNERIVLNRDEPLGKANPVTDGPNE